MNKLRIIYYIVQRGKSNTRYYQEVKDLDEAKLIYETLTNALFNTLDDLQVSDTTYIVELETLNDNNKWKPYKDVNGCSFKEIMSSTD
jgi:hypothetical protein